MPLLQNTKYSIARRINDTTEANAETIMAYLKDKP